MDNIFGERFAGFRTPAWHGLGTVFTDREGMTARDGFELAKLMYRFEKFPLQTSVPVMLDGKPTGSNELVTVGDKFALMRSPTYDDPDWRYINTVDKDFGVIQHEEIADILDRTGISAQWPIETVGALGNGGTMFATFETTPYDVSGQAVRRFFVITEGKDGDTGLRILITHIRVVCQNTLTAAIKGSNVQISFRHSKDVLDNLNKFAGIIGQMNDAQAAVTAAMQRLASVKIDDEGFKAIAQAAYPEPKQPKQLTFFEELVKGQAAISLKDVDLEAFEKLAHTWEVRRERNMRYRLAVADSFKKMNDEYPATAGTAWNGYNAAVEVLDCQWSKDEQGGMRDVLFGHRAQARSDAFNAAWELIKA